MAATTLVESEKVLGKAAFEALRNDPVLLPTALAWLYFEDAGEWRYLVATREASRKGPQAAYRRVRNVLKKANLLDLLPLRRVVVTTPDNPFLSALDSTIDVTAPEPTSVEFYNCNLNGAQVDGMLIYRLRNQRKRTGHEKKPAVPVGRFQPVAVENH